jgi:putative membrane protein
MTISHTFLDFIPSIFLGAPDEDSVLAILPGHELLLNGKGYEAVILTLYGCITGIILILVLAPIFIFILPKIYSYLKFIMFLLLIFTNIYLILKEKNSKLKALLVFLLSGFLGLSTLNLPIKENLLPLLTGLFASSSLITSIIKKQKLPKQEAVKKIKISKKELIKPAIAAVLSAPLCSFLPALGTGQAAIIGSDIVGEVKRREFLILLGIINAIIAGLSFITLYSINKARTGTAVAVQQLLASFTLNNLLIILLVILVSAFFSYFLTIFLARIFANKISKINYKTLSIIILLFISSIVLFFSGFLGFLIFIIATSTGLLAIFLGVRRTHLMGSLMLPSILLYFPI